MSTIKEKLYFNYNNRSSEDFGLTVVNLDGGMYDEMFVPNRTVNETKPEKRDIPIFHGVETDKRSFSLTMAFGEDFNRNMIDGIIDWLFKGEYKPLYFEGDTNRIMFSIISGDSSIVHNGMKKGYFTVNIETNSSYKYSSIMYHVIGENKKYTIHNEGHRDAYPVYNIEKKGKGDLKLRINDKSVLITNLEDKEIIEIDSLREIIKTDIPGAYRYNNIKAGELEDLYLKKGLSDIVIEGGASISLSYRESFLF